MKLIFLKKNKVVNILLIFIFILFYLSVSEAKNNSGYVPKDSIDVELFYDDGLPNLQINFQYTTGNRIAIRFTPTIFPAKIVSASFFVADTSQGSKVLFSVMSNAGEGPSSNLSGQTLVTIKNLGWNEIDLSSKNLVVDDDFYFAFWIFGNSQPQFGAENREPLSLRTYDADA
jgi:hypothetical protein